MKPNSAPAPKSAPVSAPTRKPLLLLTLLLFLLQGCFSWDDPRPRVPPPPDSSSDQGPEAAPTAAPTPRPTPTPGPSLSDSSPDAAMFRFMEEYRLSDTAQTRAAFLVARNLATGQGREETGADLFLAPKSLTTAQYAQASYELMWRESDEWAVLSLYSESLGLVARERVPRFPFPALLEAFIYDFGYRPSRDTTARFLAVVNVRTGVGFGRDVLHDYTAMRDLSEEDRARTTYLVVFRDSEFTALVALYDEAMKMVDMGTVLKKFQDTDTSTTPLP